MSQIIQPGRFLTNMIDKLYKEALIKFSVPLAKDILPQLATGATLTAINNLERKICNEDIDDTISFIKSRENEGALIDAVTAKVKHETKKQECGILGTLTAPMAVSLIASIASSLVGTMLAKGVMRAGSGYNKMSKII